MQKHQNFEAEVQANQARIQAVTENGEELIEADHYAKDQIRLVWSLFAERPKNLVHIISTYQYENITKRKQLNFY